MLDGLRSYFYERRRGIATTAGVVGALYLTGHHVLDRLEEMREQVMQRQQDRENLRKRFEQNQFDVSLTAMMHMPSLAKSIMEGMDVERLTQELQKRSKTARGRPGPVQTSDSELTQSDASLASSAELIPDGDARSDVGSIPASDASALEFHNAGAVEQSGISIPFSASSSTAGQSWVQEFNAQFAGTGSSRDPSSSRLSISSRSQYTSADSPKSSAAYLSDSFMSDSIASTGGSGVELSRSLQRRAQLNSADAILHNKSKSDLWKEIKMLTFTRTLTIIYSTVLLTLLTSVQLSIIGRLRYIQSVVRSCRDDRMRELSSQNLSLMSLLFGALSLFGDETRRMDDDVIHIEELDEQAEQKFLVLSWWLLYVGWKDVGERVRRSVEEVFEGVSLKSHLGPIELHRLFMDARRRIENEVTYEGTERRINFLSTLLPQTPETLSLVLAEGGISGFAMDGAYLQSRTTPSPRNPEADPVFAKLLAELRGAITSPAFQQVLEASLDCATDVLFDSLRRNLEEPNNEGNKPENPRLASVLPGLGRWGKDILHANPNEILDNVLKLKVTTALAALIYSNFDTQIR